MISKKRKICIIGPLPPPTHGLSIINQSMIDKISNYDVSLIILNTSAISLNRTLINLLFRSIKMIKTIVYYCFLLLFKRVSKQYISLSGGHGQFYDLILISLSRIFKIETFIHHHSFSYLNNKKWVTQKIIDISQRNVSHIVLCEEMENAIKEYNPNISTKIISNIALIDLPLSNDTISKSDKLTLGFLSNISFEKGIYEFIEIFKNIGGNSSINGIIAGPYTDYKSKKYLESNLRTISNINYVGSITGDSKSKFFNDIDILIVPSKNEAEPLIILEAMSHGVPIIARSIGCIPQMISPKNGIIIDSGEDFVSKAYLVINKLNHNSDELVRLKGNSQIVFRDNKNNNSNALDNFLSELIS